MGKLKKQRKKGLTDAPVIDEPLEEINKEELKTMTKGQLQKRQNMEWKKLRKTLGDLAKEKRTYSNKDAEEKKEKKVLRKHMIELKEQMEERHKQELEEWDRKADEARNEKQLSEIQAPKLSTAEQARLKQMLNSFL
eukprot:TRINITY_DN16949_c0_g1_i2.p1 TRINITY_DN16949_c0_g1~~TRINITY_DN16949_c0_g1_i2.p1  ORF type:complete len:137 (+),score=34.96 TRINITY_DN16949_c0_g1_i2:66-476(+)